MTIFSEEPYSRQMERLMTAIPNFKPKRYRRSLFGITGTYHDNRSHTNANTNGCHAADTLSAILKKI